MPKVQHLRKYLPYFRLSKEQSYSVQCTNIAWTLKMGKNWDKKWNFISIKGYITSNFWGIRINVGYLGVKCYSGIWSGIRRP